MKRILLILFVFIFSNSLFAQCDITGKIVGYPFGKLFVCEQFGDESKLIETIVTNANGEFIFYFGTHEIGLYRFHAENDTYFDVVYNGENIIVETNIRNLSSAMKIIESEENKQFYAYVAESELAEYKIGVLQDLIRIYPEGDFMKIAEKELHKEKYLINTCLLKAIKMKQGTFAHRYLSYFRDIDFNISETIDKKMNFLSKNFPMDDVELLNSNAYNHFVISYIKKYEPSEYLNASREILTYLQGKNPEIYNYIFEYILSGFESMQRYDDLYTLSMEFGNTCSTISDNLKTRIKSYTQLKTGETAPNIEIETLNGENFVLSKMYSNYTLIVFWATWCETCKMEIPQINEAMPLFNRSDVDVIAISIDEDEAELRKYVKDNNLTMKVASEYLGWEGKIVSNYAVYETPTMILVDKNMNIISKPRSTEQLFNDVEKLIK